jgi:hypothetical protein
VKPVVAVPLWIAAPLYLMYAVLWAAVLVFAIAIAAVIVTSYGVVGLVRKLHA